jgi:hypothetical protein
MSLILGDFYFYWHVVSFHQLIRITRLVSCVFNNIPASVGEIFFISVLSGSRFILSQFGAPKRSPAPGTSAKIPRHLFFLVFERDDGGFRLARYFHHARKHRVGGLLRSQDGARRRIHAAGWSLEESA